MTGASVTLLESTHLSSQLLKGDTTAGCLPPRSLGLHAHGLRGNITWIRKLVMKVVFSEAQTAATDEKTVASYTLKRPGSCSRMS